MVDIFQAMLNDRSNLDGPARALVELWDMALSGSPEILDQKLSEFLEQIKTSTLPKGKPVQRENLLAVDPGVPALWAIGRWADHHKKYIASKLAGSWPDIWAWIACIQRHKSSPDVAALANTACCAAVTLLSRGEGMLDLMASTPGFFALLAKIWAAECDTTVAAGLPMGSDYMPASRALYPFTSTSKPKWFDEVHLALGKDPTETGRITLETLRKRAEQPHLSFSALVADLHILHVYCHWNIMPLRDYLFSRQGCQIIKGVMERLLACQGDDVQPASLCLTFCVKYFIISLQLEGGRAWAYRMYDAPILRAIIQGSIWLTTDELYYAAALDMITPYMLFRSVLYRAEKAADTIADLGLEARMDRDGPVYKSFRRFKKLLGERLPLAEGRSIGTKICENVDCARIGKSREFLRCSGCKKVHYCSKECQKRSWREGGHRGLCKLLAEGPEGIEYKNGGGEFRLLPEDYKFLKKIIHTDMAAQTDALQKLRTELRKSKPSTKMSIVASVLDYTGPKLKVRLEPDPAGTSLAEWGDGDGYRTVVGMVNRVEQGGPTAGTIVRAILPFGVKPFPCELLLVGGMWH